MAAEKEDRLNSRPIVDTIPQRRTRLQESWRLLKENRLAFAGLAIFILFLLCVPLGFFHLDFTRFR